MELQEIKGSVAVLISGGVDSAVVVHRLCEAGIKPDLHYIKIGMEIWSKIENYSLLHSQQIPKVDVKDYPKDNSHLGHPILEQMLRSDNKIERYWVNECLSKLKELDKFNDEYLDRLEYEADIKYTIGKALDTNMFAYPVTLQHYVDLFWECGSMVGAGRGSSCSGLNHYLLGVTQLDPIEWNLPFWRLEL